MGRKSPRKSKVSKTDDSTIEELMEEGDTAPDEEKVEKPGKKRRAEASDNHRVYKLLDLVGTSNDSMELAIQTALGKASTTIRHIDWFEVKEIRGRVKEGKIEQFQVRFQAGFRLED